MKRRCLCQMQTPVIREHRRRHNQIELYDFFSFLRGLVDVRLQGSLELFTTTTTTSRDWIVPQTTPFNPPAPSSSPTASPPFPATPTHRSSSICLHTSDHIIYNLINSSYSISGRPPVVPLLRRVATLSSSLFLIDLDWLGFLFTADCPDGQTNILQGECNQSVICFFFAFQSRSKTTNAIYIFCFNPEK